MKTHKCKMCNKSEPEVRFNDRKVNGKKYKKHLCTVCAKEYNKKFSRSKRTEAYKENQKAYRAKERLDPTKISKLILRDCRGSDKKKGREFSLTLSFIEKMISRECAYCGDNSSRMTLDRVDNSIGHTEENVQPSCIRCNYLRRDMPYAAWLEIAPSVRSAREKGLFEKWNGSTRNKAARLF